MEVAQWLKFRAVNHDIMGSNPAETVYIFFSCILHVYLLNHLFVDLCAYCPCFYLYKITTMHVHLTSHIKILKRYNYTADILI